MGILKEFMCINIYFPEFSTRFGFTLSLGLAGGAELKIFL